jgi:hypothetical protein
MITHNCLTHWHYYKGRGNGDVLLTAGGEYRAVEAWRNSQLLKTIALGGLTNINQDVISLQSFEKCLGVKIRKNTLICTS